MGGRLIDCNIIYMTTFVSILKMKNLTKFKFLPKINETRITQLEKCYSELSIVLNKFDDLSQGEISNLNKKISIVTNMVAILRLLQQEQRLFNNYKIAIIGLSGAFIGAIAVIGQHFIK